MHLNGFFSEAKIGYRPFLSGQLLDRMTAFGVYEIGPSPVFEAWTYVTSGCWHVTAKIQHGVEFVLSASEPADRHIEVLALAAYYYAGPASQRLKLGDTVPIGGPWMNGGALDHELVSLPYAYGPSFEHYKWRNGHGRLLSLIPISAAERDYKIAHGVEALERLFELRHVDFTDPLRESAL